MNIIGIVGSRDRVSVADQSKLLDTFKEVYKDGDEIVSGGCPSGGDHFAEIIARDLEVPIKIYYARWRKYGKSAGFVRNTDIARDATILIALVTPDREGGTEDTIKKFIDMEKGEPIII